MNKMAKGAIATAAGVVLLIGGGGTLALWNVEQDSNVGTVTAGNMTMVAETGEWWVVGKDGLLKVPNITQYKVVPGDTLKYTQKVTVDLEGANLAADLKVDASGILDGFEKGTVEVLPVELKEGAKTVERLTTDATVTASVDFKFLATTDGTKSAGATYQFNDVKFVLDQAYDLPTSVPSPSTP